MKEAHRVPGAHAMGEARMVLIVAGAATGLDQVVACRARGVVGHQRDPSHREAALRAHMDQEEVLRRVEVPEAASLSCTAAQVCARVAPTPAKAMYTDSHQRVEAVVRAPDPW